MKNVPPELDALMWRLAEEGGDAARAEFEARHARYGPELDRRIRMVEELRKAGRTVAHRPAFTPRPVRVAPAPRWTMGAAIGLATLAVGAVAYVVASSGESVVQKASPVPSMRVDPVVPSREPAVVQSKPPESKVDVPAPVVQQEPAPERTPPYLKPRDVKIEDTGLTTAINLVAASGGLRVTVAPGFENRKVTFEYPGLNTVDALKAMGEEFGFSVLDEEPGHVLVVPAREPESTARRAGP